MRRTPLCLAAVGLALSLLPELSAGEPAIAGYSPAAAVRGKLRGLARSDYASYRSLAKTLGGNDVGLLTVGKGNMDQKPAVLVVAGVDPSRPVDTEVTVRLARKLVEAAESEAEVRNLFDRVTFYFIPQAAPDGTGAFFTKPRREREVSVRPIDDDNDGKSDEDGPDDLNGDGLITLMRVEEGGGTHVVHPGDDRVMVEADHEKGELGRYELYAEGRDDDGDGRINEDPPGGVAFDRNFTFDYPYFARGSGPHQVSEIETRAVADFAFDHPNIVLVWTLSDRDNLLEKWKPDESAEKKRVKTTLLKDDAPYFDGIAQAYEEIVGKCEPPEISDIGGSFVEWSYFHYGRWSVATRPWWIPEVEEQKKEPAEDAEDADEDEKEREEEKDGTTEDRRGADERSALAWFERQGVKGFVNWQPFDHPDLAGKRVEIGGFKPFLRENPPAESLGELAEQQYTFLLRLAGMLPKVETAETTIEALGADVWRVTATVANTGLLPTASEMGRLTREPQRLQVELKLPPGVSLVTGHGRRSIGPLAGGGGRMEQKWLVHNPAKDEPKLTLRAWSPMAGSATRRFALKEKAK